MSDYSYDPSKDPAKRGKASYAAGGNPGYPSQVASYNQWQYTPMDRRPTPNPSQANIPDPSLSQYTAPGWHAPNATDAASIANRYTPGGVPGYAAQSPMTGEAGPDGPTGMDGASAQPSILDTAPKATFTPGAPTPPQNAMQRWSAQSSQPQQSGLRPISDQRRYFWATGHIDARATVSPQQNSPAPVTFKNNVPGHSDWQPGQSNFTFKGENGHTHWSPW